MIFQLWSLVAITASEKLKPKENPDDGSPWAQHPFGKDMIKYLYVSRSFEPIERLCHLLIGFRQFTFLYTGLPVFHYLHHAYALHVITTKNVFTCFENLGYLSNTLLDLIST